MGFVLNKETSVITWALSFTVHSFKTTAMFSMHHNHTQHSTISIMYLISLTYVFYKIDTCIDNQQGYSPYLKQTLNMFPVFCPWECLLPVQFINPTLCAPLQKPGLFCKAAESVGSHTEPVGGSPPGHCWPWLSSQRPRGDWQDPLQNLPQWPGWAGVWLQSHTSGQCVWNGQSNKSDNRGLCWVKTDKLRHISVCTYTARDGQHTL